MRAPSSRANIPGFLVSTTAGLNAAGSVCLQMCEYAKEDEQNARAFDTRGLAKPCSRRLPVSVLTLHSSTRSFGVDSRGLQLFSVASSAPLPVRLACAEVRLLAIKAAYVDRPYMAVLAADGG